MLKHVRVATADAPEPENSNESSDRGRGCSLRPFGFLPTLATTKDARIRHTPNQIGRGIETNALPRQRYFAEWNRRLRSDTPKKEALALDVACLCAVGLG